MLAGRIGHLLGSTAPGAEGVGAGIRLPAVLPLMGRIASSPVRIGPADTGADRPRHRPWRPRRSRPVQEQGAQGRLDRHRQAAWVAVGSRPIDGVGTLAGTYADLVDATRTAQRLGLRGWIRTLSSWPSSACSSQTRTSRRPPCDASSAAARRRAVRRGAHRDAPGLLRRQRERDRGGSTTQPGDADGGYRLEKIESLLGHPLDGDNGRRLSTALMVHRLGGAPPGRSPGPRMQTDVRRWQPGIGDPCDHLQRRHDAVAGVREVQHHAVTEPLHGPTAVLD